MEIPVYRFGKIIEFAKIDDEDYPKVFKLHWTSGKYPIGYSPETGLIRLHRLILYCPNGYQVDHINGDKLDNRKCNLRLATKSQNMTNQPKNRGGNRFKGVSRVSNSKKWKAQITKDNKYFHIGNFTTEEEAAIAYNKFALSLHGEFAYLNKV